MVKKLRFNLRLLFVRTCSVKETEILVEQHLPKGVFVYGHAGLVINRFSFTFKILFGNQGGLEEWGWRSARTQPLNPKP